MKTTPKYILIQVTTCEENGGEIIRDRKTYVIEDKEDWHIDYVDSGAIDVRELGKMPEEYKSILEENEQLKENLSARIQAYYYEQNQKEQLQAVNAELLEALKKAKLYIENKEEFETRYDVSVYNSIESILIESIAKAERKLLTTKTN